MAHGHEDFVTEVTTAVAEAYSFRGGADAAKPASPVAKDIYLATDTKKLYICVADGAWTGFDASMLIQGVLTLYADMAGGGYEIKSIKDPTAAQSAATRAYVLAQLASYLALAGGTMSGAIAMGTNKITGLAAPAADGDAARKVDVDTVDAKLDDVTQSDVTASRAFTTVYQNTSGKLKLVTVTLLNSNIGSLYVHGGAAYCDANASPATLVGGARIEEPVEPYYFQSTGYWIASISFLVPPNYYYKVDDVSALSGTTSIYAWLEWTLL